MLSFLFVVGMTVACAMAGETYPLAYLGMIAGVAELALSWVSIHENERIVPIFLGQICKEVGVSLTKAEKKGKRRPPQTGLFGTGIAFFPFPFYQLRRFPMGVQQIRVPVGNIVTLEGKDGKGRRVGPSTLNIDVVVNFQWNVNELEEAVKNAPSPLGPDGKINPELTELIIPEVDDAVRRYAARHTWKHLYYDRETAEDEIEAILIDPKVKGGKTIQRMGVTTKALMNISIPKIELPKVLSDAIDAEQVALFNAEATRRTAAGEADRLRVVGKGTADAHTMLYDAVRGKGGTETEQNQLVESLITLKEAVQGGKATIIPAGILDLFSRVTGSKPSGTNDVIMKLVQGMSVANREKVLKLFGII
ncbi:MAG: SPFH domain-containing protein [bacterium]|nr:SPFH domain-containing protein [bacterium]